MWSFVLRSSLVSFAFFSSIVFASEQSLALSLASQQMVKTGHDVFLHNCSGCHGVEAKGDGASSNMLNPKPRNLVSGSFKFRSTPTGTLPVLGDLLRTINQGVLGTSMPSFRLMNEQEKLAVAMYVMSLRPDWAKNQGEPLFIPSPPQNIFSSKETLLASAARGRKTFMETCQTCHGDKGLGDGPSAAGLVNEENQLIVPANFQSKWIKSGRSASDVFKAISTGLDGTPMPGFNEAYTVDQRWDLVAFIFYLRGVGSHEYSEDLLVNKGKKL